MSGATAEEVMETFHKNASVYPPELLAEVTPETIVSTLTFTIGLVYIVCGMIRVHFLAEYFSEPLVSGFIVGGVFHIFIGQLDAIMGVKKEKHVGFGYLLADLSALYQLAPQTNLWTLGCALAGFAFLVVGKFVLHPQIQRCFPNRKIIIPYELILVIVATFLSDFLELSKEHGIKTIGAIPRQLPVPALPKFFLMKHLIWDALALAIIQSAMHLSVAKVMSMRKGYHVKGNQELYALGSTLVASGFFPVFPTATSLTGPAFMDECGVTSQISNMVAGAAVLAVLLAVGPLLHWLPMCILAVIVVLPLRVLLGGVLDLPRFWRQSKWDFCVWIITFVCTVCTDVIGGLGFGIAFQLFTIVARTQGYCFTQILKELRKTDVIIYFVKPCEQIVRSLKDAGALLKGRFIFASVKEAVDEAIMPRKSLSVMHSSHNCRNLNTEVSLSGF
ncbi:STAS domain-containing protein [Aphelenchoides fujianensis]|nr:STAS domain-containing protein [Aphelenchoides fujianensis]